MVAKGMQTGRGRQARAGCAGVWPGLRTRTPGCAKRSSRLEAECERLGGENQRLRGRARTAPEHNERLRGEVEGLRRAPAPGGAVLQG